MLRTCPPRTMLRPANAPRPSRRSRGSISSASALGTSALELGRFAASGGADVLELSPEQIVIHRGGTTAPVGQAPKRRGSRAPPGSLPARHEQRRGRGTAPQG